MPYDGTGFQQNTQKKRRNPYAERDLAALRRVRAALPNRWIKGAYGYGGDGNDHCIIGHCRAVSSNRRIGDSLARRRLLPLVLSSRWGGGDGGVRPGDSPQSRKDLYVLWQWNDTREDVSAVIDLVDQAIWIIVSADVREALGQKLWSDPAS